MDMQVRWYGVHIEIETLIDVGEEKEKEKGRQDIKGSATVLNEGNKVHTRLFPSQGRASGCSY